MRARRLRVSDEVILASSLDTSRASQIRVSIVRTELSKC